MRSIRRSELVGALLAVGLLGGAGVAAIGSDPNRQSHKKFETIELTDQDGKPRALDDWSGRLVVLDFMYTSCGDVCPLKSVQLARVQAELPPNIRSRVQFVSVSIDPDHDDPAALRAYAARAGADLSTWSFLTGDYDAIAAVAAAFNANAAADDANPPDHVTIVWLLDPAGHIVHQYNAEPLDEAKLQHDVDGLAPTAEAKTSS